MDIFIELKNNIMFRKFKKYLMNKCNPGLPYLHYYFCEYFGKDGYIPAPFWDWHYIISWIIPSKLSNYLFKPYYFYLSHWAEKNNLWYEPSEYPYIEINPKYQEEYDYYSKKKLWYDLTLKVY